MPRYSLLKRWKSMVDVIEIEALQVESNVAFANLDRWLVNVRND